MVPISAWSDAPSDHQICHGVTNVQDCGRRAERHGTILNTLAVAQRVVQTSLKASAAAASGVYRCGEGQQEAENSAQ